MQSFTTSNDIDDRFIDLTILATSNRNEIEASENLVVNSRRYFSQTLTRSAEASKVLFCACKNCE